MMQKVRKFLLLHWLSYSFIVSITVLRLFVGTSLYSICHLVINYFYFQTRVLRTRSLLLKNFPNKISKFFFAYNLHVLSMLQAFILSQDQTHFI